jgi:AraC-like DNA-binding protein/ligand-binding sensor protein
MQTSPVDERIGGLLEEVGAVSRLGAVYHDLDSPARRMNDRLCGFCRRSLEHPTVGRYCRFVCCNAALQSFSSGEPFFSQCWAGLLFVTVAIAPRNRVCGGVSVGGFLAADDVTGTNETVTERLHLLPRQEVERFLGDLHELGPIAPSALRGMGLHLQEATCSSGLNSADFLARQNARYRQQREIAEAAADLRAGDAPPDVLADTHQLINYLAQRDHARARQFVSRYLARLLMASNWDLNKLKARLRVLLAVVTSQEILNGASWSEATSRELRFMNRLERARTVEESCYEAAVMLQSCFGGGESDRESASVAERVTAWLQANHGRKVSAREAARAAGVSLSGLTHRLRGETGKSFRELLMEVRIAEARRLLATTRLEVRDIADRCGFFDQSHFTKALQSAINLTPGRFRRLLTLPRKEL